MTKATDAYMRSPDAGQNLTVNFNDPFSGPPAGEPASRASRRGILAALTGGAFLAAGGAAAAAHPDQALLDLGMEYDRLRAAEDRAIEIVDAAGKRFAAAMPPKPDVLRYRIEDHVELEFPAKTGGFYDIQDVRALRAQPRRRRSPAFFDLITNKETTEAALVGRDPETWFRTILHRKCPIAQARADEIVKASDEWKAEFEAVEEAFGIVALETAVSAAIEARQECARQIAAMRATTLDGLRVRAKVVADLYEGDLSGDDDEETVDRALMRATMRDLAAV